MNEQNDERMLDLLCKQATEGLTQAEENELRELKGSGSTGVDLQSLEYTAAAISTLGLWGDDRLPDHLKIKILAAADRHFADGPIEQRQPVALVLKTPALAWLGWAAAAAISLLLVANIWIGSGNTTTEVAQSTPTPTPEKPTSNQLRERFLASVSPAEVVRAEWTAGNMKDVAVAGDVVWSDARQEGYIRVTNLPKNDAAVSTYQLWIFDETQDPKTPIDGGTFDVNADGEVIIPIDAKLKARGAKAFAITMEKPGGVVVSDRKKIPALAPVKPNQA